MLQNEQKLVKEEKSYYLLRYQKNQEALENFVRLLEEEVLVSLIIGFQEMIQQMYL